MLYGLCDDKRVLLVSSVIRHCPKSVGVSTILKSFFYRPIAARLLFRSFSLKYFNHHVSLLLDSGLHAGARRRTIRSTKADSPPVEYSKYTCRGCKIGLEKPGFQTPHVPNLNALPVALPIRSMLQNAKKDSTYLRLSLTYHSSTTRS